MRYTVTARRRVRMVILRLPPAQAQRVLDAIGRLVDDPRPPGCRRLTSTTHWRIRVGDYRVVYDIDDTNRTVTIVSVGHRRDVYR